MNADTHTARESRVHHPTQPPAPNPPAPTAAAEGSSGPFAAPPTRTYVQNGRFICQAQPQQRPPLFQHVPPQVGREAEDDAAAPAGRAAAATAAAATALGVPL